ncbi:hypothetical protein LA66_00075 [Aureimonas altamirensis]|uniref:Uncharacterized protein n=1 Tax=Aureimonas altamirensis TaxID=370622 RepID=A0A0B1Q420_9HYPH|nr:hypothetical protein [Aureimonas altamirensis]KHJ55124.1 hypothetical protein LA66_00075 [Aureimonas altamirensis]
MKPASRKTTTQSIEAELSNLASRRQTLEARKVDALAKLDAAKSARRNVLAGDPSADLSRLNGDVRDVEDDIETLDSVLSDLTAQTEDAEARLAEANDKGERAVAAKTLQDIASTFDAGAAELEKAMSEVSKALAKMGAALPETLRAVDLRSDGSGRNDKDRLLGIILADAVCSIFPAAFKSRPWGAGGASIIGMDRNFSLSGQVWEWTDHVDNDPLEATAAARALVTDRLRGRADAILEGTAPADLIDEPIVETKPAKPPMQKVAILPISNFSFAADGYGRSEFAYSFTTTSVPEPVAKAAVRAGVAYLMESEEGQSAYQEELVRRARIRSSGNMIVPDQREAFNLGDPCGFRVEAAIAEAAA